MVTFISATAENISVDLGRGADSLSPTLQESHLRWWYLLGKWQDQLPLLLCLGDSQGESTMRHHFFNLPLS